MDRCLGNPAADVILDIEVERGRLHFALGNIGAAPAHQVRVRYGRALRDLAGARINDNPLFTRLEFLAPGKTVRLFVGTYADWIGRKQAERFEVRIEWRDDAGQTQRRKLAHDLGAYAQLRQCLD